MIRSLPAVIMRGGTSKGVFLHRRDVPAPGPELDALVLQLMGSPDAMQIDGLGGTHSSTSKVVIVSPSERADVDVTYRFGQVGVADPSVDWSGNCGNLTTAVGQFAIDEGLIAAREPRTTIMLLNENTGVRIASTVEVAEGRARTAGPLEIAGVPGTGAPITTAFLDPAGGVLGSVLPTNTPIDVVGASPGSIEVSILDVTHPYAFVRAADLGIDLDHDRPESLNHVQVTLDRLERIRGACACLLGLVTDVAHAAAGTPVVPRLILVGRPNATDRAAGVDIRAMGVSMGSIHHALPVTGALCLAAACTVTGTVPAGVCMPGAGALVHVRHPKGVVVVSADVDDGLPPTVRSVSVVRTARRLFSGTAYLHSPSSAHAGQESREEFRV